MKVSPTLSNQGGRRYHDGPLWEMEPIKLGVYRSQSVYLFIFIYTNTPVSSVSRNKKKEKGEGTVADLGPETSKRFGSGTRTARFLTPFILCLQRDCDSVSPILSIAFTHR